MTLPISRGDFLRRLGGLSAIILLDRSVWRDARVKAGDAEISRFAFHHEGYVVWGMTEKILSGLLGFLGE